MKTDEETRADVARRRLAQLTAAFEGRIAEPVDAPAAPKRKLEPQHVKVLATVLMAAAVVTVWWLLSSRPQATPDTAPLALSTATSATSVPPEVVIDVEGKVRRPGIVTLPKGSRVVDAIKAAGGLSGKADTASLNMARKVDDGEQILVGVAPVPGAEPVAGAPGAKVNLNTATMDQLDELPGVGPVTAKSILDWRTKNGHFTKVEDLLDVNGIGQATLDDLRDLVTV